ncbi:MAG: hypothetical protein KAX39_02380 [candidate division Zixibacteria bacterium]|nr:hypothetical protein [candidate division Zixibacteria bacterium]
MRRSRFTKNKQVVRDLQYELIQKKLVKKSGRLRYFGLPSDEMKDVRDWKDSFSEFVAVERGEPEKPWKKQHSLMLTAFRCGLLGNVILLRGDIDSIILDGKDEFGKRTPYPFDVISLDYSGGLLYRDAQGKQRRLDAVRKLVEVQSAHKIDYLLFISCNLDCSKDAEILRSLENIKTELQRYGANGEKVIRAYLAHDNDQARLKLYVPYFINQVAAFVNYACETEKVNFYLGNLDTQMMNFRFYLKPDPRTTAPRFPKERLVQLINSPMLEIRNGKTTQVTLGLPKLRVMNLSKP